MVADGVGEALAFVVLALVGVVFKEDFFEALAVGAVCVGEFKVCFPISALGEL